MRCHAADNKDQHAERWRQTVDHQIDDQDHAEVDRIYAGSNGGRQKDWPEQQDRRADIQNKPDNEQDNVGEDDDRQRTSTEQQHEIRHQTGDIIHREQKGKGACCTDQKTDCRCLRRCLPKCEKIALNPSRDQIAKPNV